MLLLRRFLSSSSSPASLSFSKLLAADLTKMREAGLYKKERVISSTQSARVSVVGLNKPVLNFCANNYLGLADDPEVKLAAIKTVTEMGFGLSSVRFICGTQTIHKELEHRIAQFHGMEDAILFPSCFDANAGIFEGLLGEEDIIISDELNHASIIDGTRLARKVPRLVYRHLDVNDLEEKLKSPEAMKARTRLVATDGAFSMDGDIAPLNDICDAADRHNALVFIDECHATGFIGPTGRGTPELHGVQGRVHIINSTLGKALGGGTGGYTTSCAEVVDMLRQRGRPYLFSNSIAPAVVGASLRVFDMLSTSSVLRDRVASNTARFREGMTRAGFTLLGNPSHPIAPVMLGDARLALEFADEMLKKGIYVIGFCFPVVPKGKARIRVQISAGHTPEQVDEAVQAFTEVGRAKGVIA